MKIDDVKANPWDFCRYINSQKKDTQSIPSLKRKNGKGVAQLFLEKAEEFNGQFTDVFNKNEHTQVPLLDRSAPFMNEPLLKSKFFSFGIGGKTLKWIDYFLCFRQKRVVVNGVKSDWAPVWSSVSQDTVLGPLLFFLYINDISSDIESEIRRFADDCVCYREIKHEVDTMKLQRDIDRLGSWTRKWGMRIQPVKCNMTQLTRKQIKKIHASFILEGTDLENVESIKYLGVTITSDLRWNTHVSHVCTKANRTLGFLKRNLYSCPQEVKEAAYKGLVRPVLDYGSSVWGPPGVVLQEELESVQKRAARFVTGNYNYETGSMTGILGQLKWESLKKRRKDNRLILLYKGFKGKASVPTDDLIPKTRRCRNQHSMAFQTPIANTDVYKGASSPGLSGIGMPSPILWPHLLKMQRIVLLSSLLWWELGTNSLITGPGEWLSFRRFTSKLSWPWSWWDPYTHYTSCVLRHTISVHLNIMRKSTRIRI